MYKHLHMCLSTNKRLFMMNLTNSSNCKNCTANREETPLHMLYECNCVKPVFLWVLRCLLSVCNFRPPSNICLHNQLQYNVTKYNIQFSLS